MTFSTNEKEILDQDRGVTLVKSWIERGFTTLSFELVPDMCKPPQSTLINPPLLCRSSGMTNGVLLEAKPNWNDFRI